MSHRRYRVGEHPKYDRHFDYLKSTSPILNGRGDDHGMVFAMSSKVGLEGLLMRLEGDVDLEFRDGQGNFKPAQIKGAREALAEFDLRFQALRQRCINEGKRVPAEMPAEMAEEKLKAEATVDITEEEIEKIHKLLAEVKSKEKKVDAGRVLQGGPRGSGKLLGGELVLIDGQNVSENAAGVLVISDKRSPYNGMEVADYREFVIKPWQEERRRLREEIIKKIENKELPGTSFKEPTPPLPPWPENVPKPAEEMARTK